MTEMDKQHVAVGIIVDKLKGIFITQRRKKSELAGYWEFPGGKVEKDEFVEAALHRELREELGIEVKQAKFFKYIDCLHHEKKLRLHFYFVYGWQGEPYGREGQTGQWCPIQQLEADKFPPANQTILVELQQNGEQLLAFID